MPKPGPREDTSRRGCTGLSAIISTVLVMFGSSTASLLALPAPEEGPPPVVLVEGQITDAIGSGLKEAKVELYRKNADGTRGELLGSTSTDQFGDFKIEAKQAVPGEALVLIAKPMFKDFTQEVTLGEELPPYVAATLAGSVSLRGTVKSALAGRPVVEASVKLTSGYQDWTATTDTQGEFVIEGIYPGSGELVVEAAGFGRERTRLANVEADEPVVVELKPERTLKLKVVDDQETPVAGVTVELADQDRGDFRLLITDEEGEATAAGLHFDADKLAARLEHEGHVPSSGFDRQIELPKDEVASEHRLIVQRAARVVGTITDAKSGQPVYGARVIVGSDAHDNTPRDWTDTGGKYEVIGVPPGDTVVTVHMAGFAPELKKASAKVGESVTLDIALGPPAKIEGIITDADGKPYREAEATATSWRELHTLGIRAVSDEEGKFSFSDAPHDPFEIMVYASGGKAKSLTVSAADPQPIKITLEAAPQPADIQQVAAGTAAPELTFKGMGGETIELASLRGKVVLLDFWATWCGPCLQEMPHLVEVHEKFGKREDFVMIGVSRDFAQSDLTPFLKSQPGVQWLQVVGPESGADEAAERFGVSGIPVLFLIDRQGMISKTDLRGSEVAREVETLLKEGQGDAEAPP